MAVGMAAVAARLMRLPRVAEFVRYFLASGVALAVDWCLFVLLTASGLFYLASAAAGFCAGLVVAYGLSIGFVFRERRAGVRFEAAVFCATGLAGLLITQVLLRFFVDDVGLYYAIAKIPTAGLVFTFNFLVRKTLLFSGAGARVSDDRRHARDLRSGPAHNMVAAEAAPRTMPSGR